MTSPAKATFQQECLTLNQTLRQGMTLPGSWYTDPEVFDFEKEKIFGHTWHYAGHLELVSKPGDYFSCRIGNIPVVIVRDETGQLKGFVNVCKHRGSEVIRDGT